jgi:methylene-tetrahydromethanopterin dehydrogenase
VRVLTDEDTARANGLLVIADANSVAPSGVQNMQPYQNGAPLPGCSSLGIGALTIGDMKYKTQLGLFKRMLASREPLFLDFRQAFTMARQLAA